MMEEIRYYPINYNMSDTMIQFFTAITNDTSLQKRLYNTQTLVEVSTIAKEYGYEISSADVVQSQAGRVLAIINEKNHHEIQTLITGGKPKTGAQWGRGGNGYLDNAGYWFVTIHQATGTHPEHKQIKEAFIKLAQNSSLKKTLMAAKTISDMTEVLNKYNLEINPIELLAYQANLVLSADNKLATQIAS